MKRQRAITSNERVGSREAVERAIERSKDASTLSTWEKNGAIPRWRDKVRRRRAAERDKFEMDSYA
ncbi:MAG TPA: hypothetical protein VKV77_02095 [Methylovirgula sp.]|nr:hypothetical protein [Methylovirgula sp.]